MSHFASDRNTCITSSFATAKLEWMLTSLRSFASKSSVSSFATVLVSVIRWSSAPLNTWNSKSSLDVTQWYRLAFWRPASSATALMDVP